MVRALSGLPVDFTTNARRWRNLALQPTAPLQNLSQCRRTRRAGLSYNALFVSAGGFRPGAFVAILGGGPQGLSAGAGLTVLFDPHAARRAIAQKMGAVYTFDSNAVRPAEILRELTQGNGADVIIEATGNYGKTLPEIEPSLAPHAKVVLIGYGGERFSRISTPS
jgi:threonine dehydrogenase-like Zn-dependent dehydrogenase